MERIGRQSSLPLELYHLILLHLTSKRDLCSVARASRFLRPEAERIIYHSLKFDHPIFTPSDIRLCKSIITSPTIPSYVHDLYLAPKTRNADYFQGFYRLLSAFLRRLTKLRNLDILLPDIPWAPLIFDRCTFKLVVLKVNSSFVSLAQFLATQDEVQHVELGLRHTIHRVVWNSHPVIPHIKVLKAAEQDARLVLRGRPITHLHLPYPQPRLFPELALSNGPIKVLSLCSGPPNDGSDFVLKSLPDLIPGLEVLDFVFLSRAPEEVERAGTALVDVLHRLTLLQSFELYLFARREEDHGARKRMYLDACPSLREIVLADASLEFSWMWTQGAEDLRKAEWGAVGLLWDLAVATLGIE